MNREDSGANGTIKAEIDAMSHQHMAWLWRFSPSDSPYFVGETFDYFKKRFETLGGMTSSISKAIGF
jgi:hypothetical protein